MAIFDKTRDTMGTFRKFMGGGNFADPTDFLANKHGQVITFTHLPTQVDVQFKAYIKQFQDTFSSKWTPTTGYGRMDDIQTFQQTTRKINIGFDVVASSLEEAKANMTRISTFANMLYPVFDGDVESGGQTIKSAPLVRMKFMNWSQEVGGKRGLLGTLNGFTFSPNMERGVFHDKTDIYAQTFQVSTTLTVIHEEPLGWSVSEQNEVVVPKKEGGSYNAKDIKTKKTTTYSLQTQNFPYGSPVTQRVGVQIEESKTSQQAAAQLNKMTHPPQATKIAEAKSTGKLRDVNNPPSIFK